ncbi:MULTISPECIES: alpha/beta fold hydrolase [unclassified Paenibacillus]|uniref:alpha/beta fold hydrolase n=1 Tax=unclassified Paenibacillus TaxID=185978 RepID=UPI002406D1A0|nr:MULTISPECIES: alpha/beta fold hydrolase [unclassified Paenibacillus]
MAEEEYYRCYDKSLECFELAGTSCYIATAFGDTYVTCFGDALECSRADLAGHSMGGFLTLNFALEYPERVSKLLLYAPAGAFHRMSLKFFAKISCMRLI